MPTPAADKVAQILSGLERRLKAVERGAQASRTSLEVDGQQVTLPAVVRTGIAAQESATAATTASAEASAAAYAASLSATSALTTANGKNTVTYSVDAPDALVSPGATPGDIWFQRDADGIIVGTWEWTSADDWEPRKFGDETLESLTVAKLTTGSLSAGQRIIAGDVNGTHAEVSSTGVRIFAQDPVDGVPNEVIRLGTDTDDFFGIVGATGTMAASINSDGSGSLAALDVQGPIRMGGTLIADLFAERPRGIVAYGVAGTGYRVIQSHTGLAEVSFMAEPLRAYRITVTGLRSRLMGDGTGSVTCHLHVTKDGSTPTIASDAMSGAEYFREHVQANTAMVQTGIDYTVHNPDPVLHRFLFCLDLTGNWVDIIGEIAVTIEDIGPARSNTIVLNDGAVGQPPTQPRVQSELLIGALWSASWYGSGAKRNDGEMIQGYTSYYPAGGNHRSAFGFGDLTSTLAGSTIDRVDVFLYANHWNNNVGGTAILNFHSVLSGAAPASMPTAVSGYSVVQSGWPKPGGRWVTLPNDWRQQWATGAARGLTIGPGLDTNPEYYGRFNGVDASGGVPTVHIWYTK